MRNNFNTIKSRIKNRVYSFDLAKTISLVIALILPIIIIGCSHDPVGTTGTSVSGYTISSKANPGEVRANGSDKALVVVEVWDQNGNYVDGETVTFSSTLGTLANSTVTTSNGVAVNTYTSSSSVGMGIIVASVENIVTKIEVVQYLTESAN